MSNVLLPAVAPSPPAQATAAARRAAAVAARWSGRATPVVALAALALIARPYLGVHGDAQIYLGRALANLDPGGVGRDLMYAQDGQSEFSLFPRLITPTVGALGLAAATAAVGVAALAAWCAGAGALVSAWAGPSRRAAMLAAALALPCGYGGFPISFGETLALPRPFAEALTLGALWAFLQRRRLLALALMLAASAFHPIMAAPGWAVLLVLMGLEDRRWWFAGAAATAAALVAAGLHAPVLGRLFTPMDAGWAQLVGLRAPFVFLGRWHAASWGQTAVHFTSLMTAAVALQGRARTVALVTAGVCAAALAVSALLGDGAHSLLVLQLQPWRALWLLAVLAAASLPVAAQDLWRRGGVGRLALALLLLAWGCVDIGPAALAACAGAAALVVAERRGAAPPRAALAAGWGLVLGVAALFLAMQTRAILALWAATPFAAGRDVHLLALLGVYRAAAVAAALALALGASRLQGPHRLRARVGATAAAVVALLAGLAFWDARPLLLREYDDAGPRRELRALLASRPGPVEWPGGRSRTTILAARANWQSELQGAGVVFARARGMEWARRTRRLIDLHLGDPDLLTPLAETVSDRLPTPSLGDLRAFCRFTDAPAWLIVPYAPGVSPDYPAAAHAMWRSDRTEAVHAPVAGREAILAVDRYAVMTCGRPG